MTKKISLTQNKFALVGDEDYEYLNQWKWHCDTEGYARRNSEYENGKRKAIKMHRLIMNTPEGMETDHINGNRLDNRRCNIRIATKQQNQRNRKSAKNSTSQYKGVSWYKPYNKWRASIKLEKWKHLGYFDTEEEAARIYNEFANNQYGEFARINVL